MTRDCIEDAFEAWLLATRGVLLGMAVVAFVIGTPVAAVRGVVGRLECVKADKLMGVDLPAIAQGVQAYRAQTGRTAETLSELVRAGIFEKEFDDPWGRTYLYELTPHGPRVRTLGRDGEVGGCGLDADFEQWVDAPNRRASRVAPCPEDPPCALE